MAKKQWDKAESLLLEVLKQEPSQEVNQWLGLVYQEQNQPDKALSHFKASAVPNNQAIAVIEEEN